MLFLMFLASAVAQKTYVPDNNFEQCLIDAGYDDVLDDSVTTANISGVLHLVVNSKNISDLTGLEGFTSLIDIDCRDNQITSVDLSQNTALKAFNAGNNNISSLDLSHNTELNTLYCQENNLESLNLNENKKITTLLCNSNNINSLYLRSLPGLTSLDCEHNQITSLDVSLNSLLNYLDCGKNNLTELDISSNTALEYFECDSNKITALDLSHNAALKELNCSSNKLTSLDVSNKTSLRGVECGNNSLASINLLKTTALEELYCSMNQLTSLDVSNNTSLTMLDCGANPITELDFSKNTNLTMLYFYGNYVTDVDLSNNGALTMVFAAYNNQLRTLNVNNGNNSLITYFNASNSPNLSCIIVDDPAAANSGAAPYNTWEKDETATYNSECVATIKNSYVPDNNFEQALIDLGIDIDGTLNDSVSTDNMNAATSLDVSNKNIADLTGIEEFINITTLHVNNNQLTKFDLSKNTKLKTLWCNNNQFETIDLPYNNQLTELNCSYNQLTDLVLTHNYNLQKLYCNDNRLTELDIRDFTSLTTLNCSNNRLTYLNTQNGANNLITQFNATSNPDLTCIPVDNATDANGGKTPYDTWQKDNTATYSERCDIPRMTYIPDSHFEQALITLGIDKDGLENHYVATADIEDITTLTVSNKNIADLTGIEDFSSLLLLDCSYNQITSLNISQNKFLKTLRCSANKLTALDVSQNNSLENLSCWHNSLTTLNISNNLKLTELDCNSNDLTSLDVSKNTLLITLYITDNQISEIDVSNNIALENLKCNINQISKLDVSQNRELITLYCSDNQLTRLNVGNGNNEILILFDASNNPDLTCIRVDNEAAANAGVDSYKLWKKDEMASYSNDCSAALNFYIPNDNFEQALIDLGIDSDGTLNDSLPKTDVEGVTFLDLNNKNISDLTGIEHFSDLLKLLVQNNQLTSLDISMNISLQFLAAYSNSITNIDVSSNTALDTLVLGYNQLAYLDVSKNTALKLLGFTRNHITQINLTNNTELLSLNCDANSMNVLDVSNNTALRNLRCASNILPALDVSNNTQLEYLSCSANQLSELDITLNTSLTELYCSSNQLTTIDLTANTLLKTVYCNNNLLTHFNASGLAALETIWCYDNQLPDLDVSGNSALKTLQCNNNLLSNLNVKNGNDSLLLSLRAQNNPNLFCIQVDSPADANNGVPPYNNWHKDDAVNYSDDCTQATTLNDANFEQALIDLGIISNQNVGGSVLTNEIASITKLDLSGLNITDLTGIADFTALDTLILTDNQLTYLDLTNNPNLVYLDISENPIEALLVIDEDIIKEASLNRSQDTTNDNLLYINISGTNITTFNLSYVPNLVTFIANNSKLDSLDVSGNENLATLNLMSCPLNCIQVSQTQLDNIPAGWKKETSASYSINCSAASGINEKTVNKISIYPNPVSGILYIKSGIPISKIAFYSVTGEMIKQVITNVNSVNLRSLTEGVYFVKISTQSGVAIKKLIKQ